MKFFIEIMNIKKWVEKERKLVSHFILALSTGLHLEMLGFAPSERVEGGRSPPGAWRVTGNGP